MAELHSRMEELEELKDKVQAMGVRIAKAVSDGSFNIHHATDPSPSGNVSS